MDGGKAPGVRRYTVQASRHHRACPGDPRLSFGCGKDVDGRSDAVLRTVMPGHDDLEREAAPDPLKLS
jgi:hypothetical protein